jgi:hypothetical protein
VNKSSKKPKSLAKSASKKKVVIKDLKAKDASSVKGGVDGEATDQDHKGWRSTVISTRR